MNGAATVRERLISDVGSASFGVFRYLCSALRITHTRDDNRERIWQRSLTVAAPFRLESSQVDNQRLGHFCIEKRKCCQNDARLQTRVRGRSEWVAEGPIDEESSRRTHFLCNLFAHAHRDRRYA